MGAHKYNPTAIAAKNGELPPKKPKPSKKEMERMAYAKMYGYLNDRSNGLLDVLIGEREHQR